MDDRQRNRPAFLLMQSDPAGTGNQRLQEVPLLPQATGGSVQRIGGDDEVLAVGDTFDPELPDRIAANRSHET